MTMEPSDGSEPGEPDAADAAPREPEDRLEAILQRISHVVYIKDRDGRYLLINSAGEALFDRPRDDIVGRRDEELFDASEAADIRRIDREVMSRQEATVYESTRMVKGEERTFRNEKYPYAPDGETVDRIIGISKDVTDQVERQRRIERLHEATRDLMAATTATEVAEIASSTASGILDLPYNGVHLYDPEPDALVPVAWSDRMAEELGGPPPSIPAGDGLVWRAYEAGDSRKYDDLRGDEDVLNPETTIRSELHLPLGEHGVILIGSPELDDFDGADEALSGVLAANVESALDRVDREDELKRRNERLADFAGIVSHDLRNPLNLAEAQVRLAKRTCDSEHLDRASAAHERMVALIDDVLTWAREGQSLDEREIVELSPVVRSSWETVAPSEATLEVEELAPVEANRSRLERLFENLFRNAVEHAGPDVTVRVGPLDGEAGFFVEDDGPGIPEEARGTVFEAGHSTRSEGTGFGLAIVESIVEAHGWAAEATEGADGGARFEFRGVETVGS